MPPDPPDTPVIHHRGPRRRRGRAATVGQLNLTSMIDVIFLLLIYFVITANFTFDEGVLTARLPQGAGSPRSDTLELPKQPLRIVLQSVGDTGVRITIGSESSAGFTDLYARLVALQGVAYPPDNPLIIQPAGRVRWQHVVNAFNAAVRARFTDVSFATGE